MKIDLMSILENIVNFSVNTVQRNYDNACKKLEEERRKVKRYPDKVLIEHYKNATSNIEKKACYDELKERGYGKDK